MELSFSLGETDNEQVVKCRKVKALRLKWDDVGDGEAILDQRFL